MTLHTPDFGAVSADAIAMSEPHVIEFARCRVEIWPSTEYLQTVFEYKVDGEQKYFAVGAAPNGDMEYIAKAAAWGHNSPWEMCLYHEVAHSFCAARLGLDYSPALFAEAHQIPRPKGFHTREEDLVIAFTRAVLGRPWPVWMTFPLRQVLQGGIGQFRDMVGGITND